jgi:hypothetical protein
VSQPSLDEVLAALVASVTAAVPSTVKVYDGPVVTGADPNHSIAIGHSDVPDEPGATVTDPADTDTDLPEWMTADLFIVTCTISVKSGSSGDSAIPGLRVAAFDTLALVRAAIRGEKPCGVVGLAWARVGAVVYTPHQSSTGSSVTVIFDVQAQSRAATT